MEVNLTWPNLSVRHTGPHNISIVWRFSFEVKLAAQRASPCSSRCVGYARVDSQAFRNLYYASNHTTVPTITYSPNTAWVVVNTVASSTSLVRWNGTVDRGIITLNGSYSLKAGVLYSLSTGYWISIDTSASCSASFTMAGPGDDHSQLVSITVR